MLDNGDLTITLGTWTNVAVSYDYSSKTANFYINGILNSSVSDETIVENSSGGASLIIGALRNNFSNFQFDGNISNVLAYNSLLSSEEIQQNFNALRGRFGI